MKVSLSIEKLNSGKFFWAISSGEEIIASGHESGLSSVTADIEANLYDMANSALYPDNTEEV
jgi:hypothetical protein